MAINHKDHNHPNTPAGRATCRRTFELNDMLTREASEIARKAPTVTVVPRARQRRVAAAVDRTEATYARTHEHGSAIPRDLLGIPAYFAEVAKLAWKRGWSVTYGEWTAKQRQIKIHNADTGTITLVWHPDSSGVHAVWFRPNHTSQQQRYDSINEVIRICEGETE